MKLIEVQVADDGVDAGVGFLLGAVEVGRAAHRAAGLEIEFYLRLGARGTHGYLAAVGEEELEHVARGGEVERGFLARPGVGGLEGEVGYVVLLLPGATMGIVGGVDNTMTVAEAVKGYDYTVYFATSSTTIPTMVNDGVVVAESNYSEPMLAQDADGNFSFEMGQRFDSQFYSFPFRKGASNNTYIPREVTDGTAWNFKSACGTFNALVWDGAVVTMNEAGANSSYCTWMGDGSKNARAGIGVLKSGKPILFNTQGPVTGVIDCKGQTHEDVAAELIAAGCDRAGVVEGSGTPSLVVNGKHTAINKNDPAGDCTGTSLKKLVGALAVK